MKLTQSLKSAIALLALSLTGCASIVDGGSAHVSVTTDPSDARVSVFNRAGEAVESQQTPALFSLKRGAGYFRGAEYRLVIQKDGYAKTELNLTTTVNGWYFANLFFGGLIGLIIVDPATGAMYTLSPKNVSLVLAKQTASIQTHKDGLLVMLRKDVPAEFASRLVPVPAQ
jgi:hypothetical protein